MAIRSYSPEKLSELVSRGEEWGSRSRALKAEQVQMASKIEAANKAAGAYTSLNEFADNLLNQLLLPDLTQEDIAAKSKEDIQAYLTQQAAIREQVAGLLAQKEEITKTIGEGSKPITATDTDAIHNFAQTLAVDDDKYFALTSKKTTIARWNEVSKMLSEYGVGADIAKQILVENLDKSTMRMLLDLNELRKGGAGKKPVVERKNKISTNKTTASARQR